MPTIFVASPTVAASPVCIIRLASATFMKISGRALAATM